MAVVARNRISFVSSAKRLSYYKWPNRPWGPPSVQFNGKQRLFLGV